MDGNPLFPDSHHPVDVHLSPDVSRYARRLSRADRPIKYYFIDFGMSSYFKTDEPSCVIGSIGANQDAPELSNDIPYNPFMLDVFVLGRAYEEKFLKVRH